MELHVWKGDWGLASVDLNCLQVLAYGKFIGLPIKVVETCNPFFSPSGYLPVFKDGKKLFTNYLDIVDYLKKQNHYVDSFLNSKEQSEVLAFTLYLKEKLYPTLQYIWWIDERNYTEFSRQWYCKAIPFPLNFYYTGRYQRDAQAMIDALYGENADKTHIEYQIYNDSERCLTALSEKLSDNEFFFGARPSSLDAVAFAYLAPILKAPLKNARLQNHLKRCVNLSRFVTRICQRYFPGITSENPKDERNGKRFSSATQSDKNVGNFPNKNRNKILAALFAAFAMTFYALSNGLLQVNFKDELDNFREYNQLFEGEEDDNN